MMLPLYSFDMEDNAQRASYSFALDGLQAAFLSDPGGRGENQDAWGCVKANDGSLTICVADGLGGHVGGRLAAQCAIRGALATTLQPDFDGLDPKAMEKIFAGAQAEIIHAKEKDPALEDMHSALVVLLIKEDLAVWGHIGDARLYMLRGNAIIVQTKDQSVPQMLADNKEIKPEEIRHHPDRSMLLQALGSSEKEIKPAFSKKPRKVEPDDLFVMSTDGFWEWVDEEKLLYLYKSRDITHAMINAEKNIRELASLSPNNDNYTVMFLYKEAIEEKKQNRLSKWIKKLSFSGE